MTTIETNGANATGVQVEGARRSPFPVPYGWFQMAWPDDVAVGETKALQYFDRHLVLWRDEEGVPHVQDAFCPHLGAHFAHGGTVKGCELVCPFHGWRFNGDGENTLIPYSERTNRKGHLRTYPTIERNGLIMTWFHPHGAEPMWEIPVIPEFNDPDNFTAVMTREYVIEAPWQELAENGVDSAHFRYVHHTEQVPEIELYETDGPLARMRSKQKFPTPRGIVDGRIDADTFGPGLGLVRFSGIVDTVLMGCNTPLTANSCHMRFTFTVRKLGDDSINSTVGEAFVNEIDKQVQEDKPIWENKAHLVRPALADTDGPFMKFRKWASQFYADGMDGDALVYPPLGSYPAEAIETASRKYGTDPVAGA